MANNSRVNPMIVNTASDGGLVAVTTDVFIQAISVVASADDWVLVITDGAGNDVFNQKGSITDDQQGFFPWAVPFKSTGLTVKTATNITEALIYTVPS